MSVLKTEHLAKTYAIGFFRKKIRAIQDVNLKVEAGEIFGLLGPNGAGKTTTLKVLMGLIRSSSGHAEILGQPVGSLPAKRRLGYLPENPYFYDYLTGLEILIFMGKLFALSRSEARRRAHELLERVGLSHAANLALRRYSKGMLQRIGIAQAILNNPDLVILDEPLSGLDPIGRKDLRALIAGLRQEGKTVVFSSHILSDVELLADRVAIVIKGKTVNSGPLPSLLDARVLNTEVIAHHVTPFLRDELNQRGQVASQFGETICIRLEGAEPVDPLIDLIRKHGGSIHAVTPRKESLEDLVVKQVQAQH
jgi:ABC-2 type transport system ATP-binding protein